MTNTQQVTGNSKEVMGNIRPMIRFVPSETFEVQTAEARKKMSSVRARDTIKRVGWYYTEKCTAEEYPLGA